MIITAKKGKGNKIHISVDGVYMLTVSDDFWFSGSYRSGDEISETELNDFKTKANESRAFNKALDLVSRRDHSQKELENKLARSAGRESAKAAVQRVADLGIVNDETYANKLADELFRRKGFSPSRIRMELIQRGVSSEIADNASESIDFEPQERIIELLKNRFLRQLSDEKGKVRAFNALVRLGYSFSDIRSAMRALDIEIESCQPGSY